jgi:NAD(P)H-hydrate epimerase
MVFCGTGNNGGDGIAVARMLKRANYSVEVFKVLFSSNASPDFLENEKRFLQLRDSVLVEVNEGDSLPQIPENATVIDAMFGSGLNRPLEGFPAQVVHHINKSDARIVALDMPSGLFGEDNSGNINDNIIRADYTFTFQLPKLSFLVPDNAPFLGTWSVLDIGLSQEFINSCTTPYHFLTAADLQPSFRYRRKFDHKGHFGHSLLIAGSKGKAGAAVLASQAALKMGVGLLSVHVPGVNYTVQQLATPEAMVETDEEEFCFSDPGDISGYSSIAAGPGLGQEKNTQQGLKLLIQNSSRPLVLDADALNILSENKTWLSFLPAGTILTPHVGEMTRLTGDAANGWERLQIARDTAFKFRCYIVLKGAHTAVVTPDKQVVFNSTGNPGMAAGGSGDVLTGMIAGLLAQDYSPLFSAMAGVYLHGLAADIAVRKMPPESLGASNIIQFIPKSIQKTFY